MSRKKKNAERERQSTRQLIGIDGISEYSLLTSHGELVFFSIKPTNIGIYFISEDIYTLASYYQEDLKDPFFLPVPDWQLLPDDALDMRGLLHD